MNIRLADEKDIDQLIRMRWDFTIEHDESGEIAQLPYEDFENECQVFLQNVLNGDKWFIWVAEENGSIVSHIYIELIQKVPRPGRVTHPFAYMTNVYTIEEYRNKGIGSSLLSAVNEWVREMNYEFVIVWPSDEAINFYGKNGYVQCKEPMEYFPGE
ncbi:GNAT family N-acetyltransferase [Ferdinandcohnia quinoae]|uniref:GNAT family N-acetyltransferase n=1 Tax=Fredinandcohnia quinoae TaxID=2918902 RepID=A0AAW5DX77_9BACI|nr:GNAT family N-acetyltransferase [Fredinandcohnia sp. SECRCQ15]MCH1625262.1 GNAT family N-acetyltransferase [Fredinandcohnia sp. SECRCQ15]